ncbi:hypothetical protein AXG55_07000 [Silvanigrella aquatica]|uniref:Uncharacterized protein n=1 Tax=Silvanigrella aquatica TaxID=1915309 RepID=A0A1L4D0F4_9BACT|nr:hypothetical protein AXG55_07000 [Silvanigrella aquatica]
MLNGIIKKFLISNIGDLPLYRYLSLLILWDFTLVDEHVLINFHKLFHKDSLISYFKKLAKKL